MKIAGTRADRWQAIRSDARPVLVLDFDGTICLGDDPARGYADAVIAELRRAETPDVDRLADSLIDGLDAYLAGNASGDFVDGYDAVARLSSVAASPALLSRAYLTSRDQLGDFAIHPPAGLHELLDELGGTLWRVLLTNAPDRGLAAAIHHLGLADSFDVTLTDAGKPAGWTAILAELTAHRAPHAVLSIGDIWRNDLQQPLLAGAMTGLVDRFDRRPGPAHLIAQTLPELHNGIRSWATDPATFASAHHPTVSANS